jgi:hypothetical protein
VARVIARTTQEHNLGSGENIRGEREDHHTLQCIDGLDAPKRIIPEYLFWRLTTERQLQLLSKWHNKERASCEGMLFRGVFPLNSSIPFSTARSCQLRPSALSRFILMLQFFCTFLLLRFQALGSSSQSKLQGAVSFVQFSVMLGEQR